MSDLKGVYAADDLGPLIVAVLGMLEVYFGFKGASAQGNNFANSLPIFWAFFGTFAGVVVGSLAGAYAGLATINGAVRTQFWAGKNSVFRASYYVGYGGNSVVGSLLGFLEMSWVALYLILSSCLVIVPYYILSELANFLNANLTATANQVEQSYRLLGNGFLLAFGSWMSAWATKLSVEKLVGWFDKQNTDANSANNKVDNETALALDFLNHGAITVAYMGLAWTIAGSTWAFVYGQLTDQSLNNK